MASDRSFNMTGASEFSSATVMLNYRSLATSYEAELSITSPLKYLLLRCLIRVYTHTHKYVHVHIYIYAKYIHLHMYIYTYLLSRCLKYAYIYTHTKICTYICLASTVGEDPLWVFACSTISGSFSSTIHIHN